MQSYTTNSAKVVFLNQRPQTRNFRGSGNFCSTCDRSLQDPYHFCSLSCKVFPLVTPIFALSPTLPLFFILIIYIIIITILFFSYLCNVCLLIMFMFMFISSIFFSRFCFCFKQINYLVRTTDSLCGYLFECNYLPLLESGLDDGLMMTPDSVLEPSGSGGYGGVDCRTTLACTATTEIVRKKRTGGAAFRLPFRPACSPVSEISACLMNRRKGNPQRAPLH